MRDDLEMNGLATDHAAERNDAIIWPAPAPRGVDRKRNRGRNLQRTGHADAVERRLRLLERPRGGGKQRIGNLFVEARLDNEQARPFAVALVAFTPPRPGHCCAPFRGGEARAAGANKRGRDWRRAASSSRAA